MAAIDAFLQLDGITGESRDSRHPGAIELNSWSFGVANAGVHATSSGGGTGRVAFQEIHVTAAVSLASPQLMLHCATGKHITQGTITVRKAGDTAASGQEFLIVVMKDVVITSVQNNTNTNEGPTETFTLAFSKVEFEYKPQKPDGTLGPAAVFSWDLKTNRIPPP